MPESRINHRESKHKIIIASIVVSILFMTSMKGINVQGAIDIDMDHAGNHIVRDDDGDMNSFITQYNGDQIYKKLWIYYSDIVDSDYIQLWIYGKMWESMPAGITHEIYVNEKLVMQFEARKYFVPGEWKWAAFRIFPQSLITGYCNEICIKAVAAGMLDYGIDTTFNRVGKVETVDFGRSYWSDIGPPPVFYGPDNFNGEFMIYLEFIAESESWSRGYKVEDDWSSKTIKYWDPTPSTWDSVGFELDWTGMTQSTLNKIYEVRFWVYCQPDGQNVANDFAITLRVNGITLQHFNPWKICPSGNYAWLIFTIFDRGADSTNLINGLNHIELQATDVNNNQDNLKIAKYSSTIDNQYTWWYIKTGSNPDTFDGAWRNPVNCVGDLVMRVQVFESDSLRDANAGKARFGSSAITNNRDLDFNGYTINAALAALGAFTADPAFLNCFLTSADYVRQWTIYGEQRGFSDVNTGDMCDIYFHYGPGKTGTIALFDLRIISGTWQIGLTTFHNNDDYHDFTHTGTTMTEAENNDYATTQEDDGSDGFNFNLEWIFFFSPEVLSDGSDSWFQSLLWHGAHGVYGFNTISTANLDWIETNLYPKMDAPMSIVDAFESACDWKNVQGRYFHNTNVGQEDLWGQGQASYQDSLVRTAIVYATTQ